MQFNVKHYIAIGLSIGVVAAYFLHLGSDLEKRLAFQPAAGDLQELSSFDFPDPNVPTPDEVDPVSFAKLQQNSVQEFSVDQRSVANDFAPLETVGDSEDALSLSPSMLDYKEAPESSFVADSSSDIAQPNNVESSEEIGMPSLAKSETESKLPVINVVGQSHQPRVGWKKNPFMGAGSNVRVASNSPQTVRSLQDQTSQIEGSLNSQSIDLPLQTDSVSPDAMDPNLEPAPDSSVFLSGSVDSDSYPAPESYLDSDTDNVFVPHTGTPIRLADIDVDSAVVRQQDNLVQQETEETAITPLRTALSPTAAQQSIQHIEYGKSLSRRGAVFAARQEFFLALSIIAQSKDEIEGGTEFSKALTRGFLTLKETEGFVFDNVEAGTTLDVAAIVETHRSNVITQDEAGLLSPVQATQKYFEFAQSQLDYACGQNAVSAEAFFCLGKLFSAVSKTQSVPTNLDTAKSIVFHQVALQSDEKNYRSANELGVLMAQTGRLREATEYFKQSLIVNRTPQAWMNLAKTHRRLGETEFAELAESEFVLASQAPLANSHSAIQWVPTENFNALAPTRYLPSVASKPDDLPKTASGKNKIKSLTKSFSERFKELF